MELLISRRTPLLPSLLAGPEAQEPLTAALRTLLQREGIGAPVEISLVLCDDDFVRELNARYRGRDTPTDVLSFGQDDFEDAAPGPRVLGDVVISLPTAARQAARAGWDVESETTLLAVHGLLHLLGYDDETEEGARGMQARTLDVLAACGIALPTAGIHPFFAEHG